MCTCGGGEGGCVCACVEGGEGGGVCTRVEGGGGVYDSEEPLYLSPGEPLRKVRADSRGVPSLDHQLVPSSTI